jgi:preprotein translocase subunit YajC
MNPMPNFFANLPLLMGQQPGGTGQAGGGSSMITMLATFGLIIVIFYFLIIRPQRKKQKDTQNMLSNIRKGDRVSTIGGIRGTVHAVKESTVVLKVDDNAKIEFNKNAISAVLERREEEASEAAEEKKE